MRKMNWLTLVAGAAIGLFAIGCTSSSNNVQCSASAPCQNGYDCVNGRCVASHQLDGGQQDQGPTQDDGGPQPTCDINGFTPVVQTVNASLAFIYYGMSGTTEPADQLSIELWQSTLPAAGDTIELGATTGDQNYKTCTTCVVIYKDLMSDGTYGKAFFATGGTLTITAIGDPGTHFTGTLTNVTLEEVTIATDYTSTPVANGQTWCLANVGFDALNGCNTTPDCSAGVCDTANHTCVECLATPDCAGSANGTLCDTSTNSCVECLADSDCAASANGHYCSSAHTCQVCVSDFNCTDPTKPACVTDSSGVASCGTVDNGCSGDDATENGDDGPAGAPDLGATVTGHMCEDYNGGNDADYYKITTTGTNDVTIHLAWTNPTATAEDLDLGLFDHTGKSLGVSWFGTNAEEVKLTYLPAGTYYAQVTVYPRSTATTPTLITYTLTATVAASTCTADAQCSAEYAHQVLRGHCDTTSGACEFINGNKALTAGAACDSLDDCASGLCTYGGYVSDGFSYAIDYEYFKNAATRAYCVDAQCTADTDCTSPQVCSAGFCMPKCTEDAECPVDMTATPGTDGWGHLACNTTTGVCEMP